MVERAQITTQKTINPAQLKDELGAEIFTSEGGVVQAEGCTTAQLDAAVTAHTADPEWRPAGPERDWRATLLAEISWLESLSWGADLPTNANTTTIVNAINLLKGRQERLARDLRRVLKYLRHQEMDSGA